MAKTPQAAESKDSKTPSVTLESLSAQIADLTALVSAQTAEITALRKELSAVKLGGRKVRAAKKRSAPRPLTMNDQMNRHRNTFHPTPARASAQA